MIDQIVRNAPVFLLIAVRCFAMLLSLPLFSMRTVPRMAKVALAGYLAYAVMPKVDFSGYASFLAGNGSFTLDYIFLLAGEALIGIILGFYVTIIFSAFSTAGQFFAFQMGFSASEVYDALSQVENPLMGQYLNLIAMLVFLQTNWLQRLFIKGLAESFHSLDVFKLIAGHVAFTKFMVSGLTSLFEDALIISLPIMGTLCLITVCMGVLSKAAPQMNLLSEGFPIMMLVSFILLTALMPSFIDYFSRAFSVGFGQLESLLVQLSGKGGA